MLFLDTSAGQRVLPIDGHKHDKSGTLVILLAGDPAMRGNNPWTGSAQRRSRYIFDDQKKAASERGKRLRPAAFGRQSRRCADLAPSWVAYLASLVLSPTGTLRPRRVLTAGAGTRFFSQEKKAGQDRAETS